MNAVRTMKDRQGCEVTDQQGIGNILVEHFSSFLGSCQVNCGPKMDVISLGPCLSEIQQVEVLRPCSHEDIKQAMFFIDDDKSLGPDGYGSKFFKATWSLVGIEVCNDVLDFFTTGKLLGQVNATILAMVPKVENPVTPTDLRPIACCNSLYKCITKLICTRLKPIMSSLVNASQNAFVEGRSIIHNILICEDLVRLYNRKGISPRCMIKIDLKKAYDSISWTFIEKLLFGLGFPSRFIQRVMTCISTAKFSIKFNGQMYGYFASGRGLRQGDPMSPLIFVLVMEYLTRSLQLAMEQPEFRFHPNCKEIRLCNLYFADDLLLFCKGNVKSVECLMAAFKHFSDCSGLEANPDKSQIVMAGVKEEQAHNILTATGFQRGVLPFRYLGVPIKSSRLNRTEC